MFAEQEDTHRRKIIPVSEVTEKWLLRKEHTNEGAESGHLSVPGDEGTQNPVVVGHGRWPLGGKSPRFTSPNEPQALSTKCRRGRSMIHQASNDDEPLDDTRMIDVEELAIRLGISKRSVWRLVSIGQIPEPKKFGKLARWSLPRIRVWIEEDCPGNS